MTRILYLHGFASGPSSKKALYFRRKLEAAGASVEVPDLAAGDFEHLTLSGQLAVLDRAAAGEPVALMGSSMGGYLAALYAARHPEAMRLVLLAPAFAFARRWREHLGAAALEDWRRTGTIDIFHYGEDRLCPLRYGLLADSDSYEPYPDFQQPALIFHGVRDDTVPPVYSRRFAAAHPNVRLGILESGHDLLDVLDYMAPVVVEFLTR